MTGVSAAVAENLWPHVGGKFIYLGNQKFYVRGVTYGPFHPDTVGGEYHSPDVVEHDFAQMAATDPTPESAAIDAAGGAPRLAFHQVPEAKTVKNRLHLDLISAEFGAESERLLALGATRIRDVEHASARWTTSADPTGNEFDLVAG